MLEGDVGIGDVIDHVVGNSNGSGTGCCSIVVVVGSSGDHVDGRAVNEMTFVV